MTDWREVKLSDVCNLIAGFAFKSKDFGDYSDKVIKITNIEPPFVNMDNLVGVNLSNYKKDKLEKFMAYPGEYVLAMTGATIGKLGRICCGRAYINQRILLFRPTEYVDNRFLYYILSRYQFSQYILNHIDSESAQPNISANTIGKYSFLLPPLEVQRKIAGVLGVLDDKIELNNKINQNLELQAQALFKSWFVDFEPFGGKMPDDWKIGKLEDVVDVIMGQSPSGNSYNEKGRGCIFFQGRAEFGFRFPTIKLFTTEPRRMARQNDILMSVRAPVGDVNVAHEDCCIGRGLCAIRSKDNFQSFILYTLWSIQNKLNIFNGEGTVFGSINKDSLNNLEIIVPNSNTIQKFENLCSPLDNLIRKNYEENTRLSALRDTLSPKLMSGEIDVEKVDISALTSTDKLSFTKD